MEDSKQVPSNTDRVKNLLDILKANIGDYFMFFALVIIMIFFTITTDGVFISSRNISNLINQMGYIAVLAVGMTLIIVIRHIEL
jgi:putative multiple sugar transport system permease protein